MGPIGPSAVEFLHHDDIHSQPSFKYCRRGELSIAVARGLAGPVLAGPVFTVIFKTAHVQIMNNE